MYVCGHIHKGCAHVCIRVCAPAWWCVCVHVCIHVDMTYTNVVLICKSCAHENLHMHKGVWTWMLCVCMHANVVILQVCICLRGVNQQDVCLCIVCMCVCVCGHVNKGFVLMKVCTCMRVCEPAWRVGHNLYTDDQSMWKWSNGCLQMNTKV